MSGSQDSVLVLGGGPDAEHDVSVRSAEGVAAAAEEAGWAVDLRLFRTADEAERLIESVGMGGVETVVFPVLHGQWGEGGPLQRMLEGAGCRYVGCAPSAAAFAMDKMATKLLGASMDVPTADAVVLSGRDVEADVAHALCAVGAPAVVKPIHEGSSVGLWVCSDELELEAAVREAREKVAGGGRSWMVERAVMGRELTVGMLVDEDGGLEALPIVEIVPAEGVFDYEAKYERGDTRYVVGPDRVGGGLGRPFNPEENGDDLAALIREYAEDVCMGIGVRHLARVDFMVSELESGESVPYLLEVNTMPGFTATSLLPKAAADVGLDFPAVVDRLVRAALADGPAGGKLAGR